MVKKKLPEATAEQKSAWEYYGTPKKAGKSSPIGKQVGEVRYVIGWMSDQMVRMGWRVTQGGSEDWTVTLPDGGVVRSDSEETDMESVKHPANASRRLLEVIDWNSRTVREVTTNLFVAGELHYALEGDRWRVVSVIRSDRDSIVDSSSVTIHGIWPHPADPTAPDAPIFGVLGVLDDMSWLNRLSRSQSANRVGMRGIIGVADSWATAKGAKGDEFWDDFVASLSKPMDDPEDISPVGLIGSAELVEPKDGGMKGLTWIVPDLPYDDKVDERMEKLVQRLAYGLPIPPEILLGMQAQSKATAFQVEGATYRAHIEPVALLVSRIATDTLSQFLEGKDKFEVIPDPTAILARRHSVADAFEAFDRGIVNFEYAREVIGFPARAKLTEEDIQLLQRIKARGTDAAANTDPANEAAEEPIAAAATLPSEDVDTTPPSAPSSDDEWLEDRLYQIDTMAFYELVGASAQAVTKAREKLGARLRSSDKFKKQVPAGISNEDLALKVGESSLRALGIDVDEIITSSTLSAVLWWSSRIIKAQDEVHAVLEVGNVPAPEFSPDSRQASISTLESVLATAVFSKSDIPEADLRSVLELAGK